MPNVLNAFRILKPIQKSSKRVWVFRNTGANAFAKNQMRLAYEDKRDLYCSGSKKKNLKGGGGGCNSKNLNNIDFYSGFRRNAQHRLL